MTWPQYCRRECSYKGWTTKLAPLEAEVLLNLILRGPRPTPPAMLADVIWADQPDGGPLNATAIIHKLIGRLRMKLPGAITGRQHFGWFLI